MRCVRRLLYICLIAAVSLGACAPQREARAPFVDAGGQQLEWQQLAPVPTPRTEVTAAARGVEIFVIGGFADSGGTVDTVEVYDTSDDTWRTGPSLPLAVNHAMSATLGGTIYVLGGYRGPGLKNPTRRAFALAGEEWTELPRMPQVRAAAGAAVVRGKIYVAAGVGPDGLADKTFVLDPATRKWATRKGVPTPRQHLGVVGARRRVWVVAGREHGFDTNMDRVESYSVISRRWKRLPNIPTARGGLEAAATSNGFVVAAGGEGTNGTFDEVEVFDIPNGRWRSLPPMPTARHGIGIVAIGTTVYVVAGGPQPGLTYSDANEALDLSSLR